MTYKPGMKLVEVIHYQPQGLEMETPEFVERLAFLGAPFSFDRKQLALLVKTLNDQMNEDGSMDDDDDSY